MEIILDLPDANLQEENISQRSTCAKRNGLSKKRRTSQKQSKKQCSKMLSESELKEERKEGRKGRRSATDPPPFLPPGT
ncbi:unnamed protein product [Thelazia callipaeda]|uniref:BZIP domain-containing protein n=1 Tax=Thelazia callipaeda TaxID=103827 RepID=A0A0N5CJ27_THECL|nr:unnamed protein product [Thelazia callipaeda]